MTARRWWQRGEILAAVLAVAAYLNALPNDFCYDDGPIVRHNKLVHAPLQWGAIWTSDLWAAKRDAWR